MMTWASDKMALSFAAVYAIVRQIPPGRVATYGQLARLCGAPRAARMVGYAMSACPAGSGVPCHRVVDRLGGTKKAFDDFAPDTQRHMLEVEGVPFLPDGRVDLRACLWEK